MSGVAPGSRYLRRLHERVCAQAFDRNDEVFKAVDVAEGAMHSFWLTIGAQIG